MTTELAPTVKLSGFQDMLLRDMEPGVWYDCFYNQGSGGAVLPEWFYWIQTNAMATLRPMLRAGVLELRVVGDPCSRWTQVRKAKRG